MKTPLDPRHKHRIKLMQDLFRFGFDSRQTTKATTSLTQSLAKIDPKIQAAAPEWPIAKIAKIDLAILRLAVWELAIVQKEPPKVIIDEAVELAKAFGNEASPKFVNGVLGTILKTII